MRTPPAQLAYRIHGMDCAGKVTVLKPELRPIIGDEKLRFDVLNAKMTVAADAPVLPSEVRDAVCIGQWLEATTVAFLFARSLSLEAWASAVR